MSFNYALWVTWGLGFCVTVFPMVNDEMTERWESAQIKIILGPLIVNIGFPVSKRVPKNSIT